MQWRGHRESSNIEDRRMYGSSAQRVQWFKTGLSTGNLESCSTFKN